MPDASDGMIASLGPARPALAFSRRGANALHLRAGADGRSVTAKLAGGGRERMAGYRKPPYGGLSQTGRNPAISPGRGRNRATQRWANKENTLANPAKTAVADAQFKKTQREQDGKKAMAEYEANGLAMRAKTAKLRELRPPATPRRRLPRPRTRW